MSTPQCRRLVLLLFQKQWSSAAPCRYGRRAPLSSSPSRLPSSDKPSVKPQLSLASLGFTEDGKELEPPWYVTGRRRTGTREKKKVERVDEEKEEQVQVVHTHEEVKKAALDASNILAEIGGFKIKKVPSKKKTKEATSNETEMVISQLNVASVPEGPAKGSKMPEIPANTWPVVKISENTVPVTKAPANATKFKVPALVKEVDGRSCQEISVNRQEEKSHLDEPPLKHPWSEWVKFLEFLLENKFFDGSEEWAEEEKSLIETKACVRHATVAFGRDRGDIFRFFSQEDLKVLANYGCPDMEKKASNACKRLRLSLNISEGQVCLKCRLKMSCPRAFLDPPMMTSPCPRTLDVVRIITNFALNASPTAESPVSYPAEVCETVCRLFREIVTHGAFSKDPFFGNEFQLLQVPRPKKVKHQPQTDWLCPNCGYLNFAKNVKCRECGVLCPEPEDNELPEDWQCLKCKYLNYDRNIVCRRCKAEREKKSSDQLLGYRPWKDGSLKDFEGRSGKNMDVKFQGFSYGKENFEKRKFGNMSNEIVNRSRRADKIVGTAWSRGIQNRSDSVGGSSRHASNDNHQMLKLNALKRAAIAESNYEASKDASSDLDNHLEGGFSDSDFDLSADKDGLSSAPLRTKVPEASHAWAGEKKGKAHFSHPSKKSSKQLN